MSKKIGLMICLFVGFVIISQVSSESKTLFDDFSQDKIDYEKWGCIDSIKEIFIQDERLYGTFTGYAQSTGYDYQNLPFPNPESIYAIKAMVTIHDVSSTDGIGGEVQFGGHFYSDQYGDVWVEIAINKNEDDLYASWTIHSNGSGQGLAGGIIKQDLQFETAYELSLSYNEDDNLFTFSIDGNTVTSEGINKQGEPSVHWKTIDFGVCCGEYEGPASISASIDDVYINNENVVYDDFNSTTIDTTKWDTNSSKHIMQIENDTLHLLAQGNDSKTSTAIWPLLDNFQFLEAEITVNDSTYVSAGARGKIRIGRSFYNDTYGPESGLDYNGDLGEVWGEIQIGIADDNRLTAYAQAYRADDTDWNTETALIDQPFSTVIQKGENYTLSIEFTGEQLIFVCNDETITYDIETQTYEPQDKNFYITSRVYLDQGEEGIFDATIDNVYIKEINDEERINWSYIGIGNNEINAGFSIHEEFADQIDSAELTGPDSFSGSFDLIEDYDESANTWQAEFGTDFLYGTYTLTVFFLDSVEETYDRELTFTVLTETMPGTTVSSNEAATIYGTLEENPITIESGGNAKLINFPGNNTITIQEDSERFTVSRSGANVIFESTSGTIIQIPATSYIQNIIFNDRSMTLTVSENQVKLGNQIIDLDFNPIENA